jgi:hypothetical protein
VGLWAESLGEGTQERALPWGGGLGGVVEGVKSASFDSCCLVEGI